MSSEYGYAAGILDGEGWIGIAHERRQGHEANDRHSLRVVVTNQSLLLLEWLQERWGGRITEKKTKPHHNRCWRWQVEKLAAEQFLRDVRPYCIVKAPQIELALEFRALRVVNNKAGIPPEMAEERERIREAIKVLNQRRAA